MNEYKKCMVCSFLKPIRKECDPVKTRNENQIHEYNYTCFNCLEDLKQKNRNELEKYFLYQQLKFMGIIQS